MDAEHTIYVRLIDGTDCLAPLAARENPDGTFCLSANPDFDTDDASTLYEFLPGDVIRVESRMLADAGCQLVATELVRSSMEDRNYWAVLFCIASRATKLPAFGAHELRAIASRVVSEIDTGVRWHYPSVVDWGGCPAPC